MAKVKLTVVESKCRCGYCKKGANLDYGEIRSPQFDVKCPDGGRVWIHGERIEK